MKVPKVYSSGPIRELEEIDDKYLNPVKQIKHIDQRYDFYYSPFVKDYNELIFSRLNTEQKLNLIFETTIETKKNVNSMLTAILVILIIILFKIISKK
jgi:hypothetical protein